LTTGSNVQLRLVAKTFLRNDNVTPMLRNIMEMSVPRQDLGASIPFALDDGSLSVSPVFG